MTATNLDNDGHKQRWPQVMTTIDLGNDGRHEQRRPQVMTATNLDNDRMTATNIDNDGHSNDSVHVSRHCCGRHCLWPSLYRLVWITQLLGGQSIFCDGPQ